MQGGEEEEDDGGCRRRVEDDDGIGRVGDAGWRNKVAAGEFFYCSIIAKITHKRNLYLFYLHDFSCSKLA